MNIAKLHEAIAAAIPDAECLVHGERRMTWGQINDRTRRLAAYFTAHGLGLHTQRESLENWQSGQDHIALYMYNCSEYMEGMLGAFKCRASAVNVNYRYKEDELVYLLDNSQAKCVIYHAQFAPMLQGICSRLPHVRLWIQVADHSGEPLMRGAVDYETILASTPAQPMDQDASSDDLYIVYTGGTTGMPKGVLWRQEDMLFSLISQLPADTPEQKFVDFAQQKALDGASGKCMPLAPMMHASGSCMAFGAWFRGDVVVLQNTVDRFDSEEIVATMEREQVTHATLIGDAFAQPLLQEMDRKTYNLSAMAMINSGGAVLSQHNKARLQKHMPNLVLIDAVGSSEAGSQAVNISTNGKTTSSVNFQMLAHSCLVNSDRTRILAGDEKGIGWVAQGGHVAMGYLNDAHKSAETFPVIDGMRYAVPGDRAKFDEAGGFHFLGRDSITINSAGEKIFAEEVEVAIKSLEGIEDAQVVGVKSQQWGQKVVALVSLVAGGVLTEDAIRHHCRSIISTYKVPKQIIFMDTIKRAPNGKADYKWAADIATRRSAVDA